MPTDLHRQRCHDILLHRGQFSHLFAWIFKVTALTPKRVYAVCATSPQTGADVYDSMTVTCTNGCTISASGVGSCPDQGFKVVGNWLFGTEGMLSYSALSGSVSEQGELEQENGGSIKRTKSGWNRGTSRLEIWGNDGTHSIGPPVLFEHLDQEGTGPGSLDALIAACRGAPYYNGSSIEEGIKVVATVDAMYRSSLSGMPQDVVMDIHHHEAPGVGVDELSLSSP